MFAEDGSRSRRTLCRGERGTCLMPSISVKNHISRVAHLPTTSTIAKMYVRLPKLNANDPQMSSKITCRRQRRNWTDEVRAQILAHNVLQLGPSRRYVPSSWFQACLQGPVGSTLGFYRRLAAGRLPRPFRDDKSIVPCCVLHKYVQHPT
ncbi:hypothetical protein CPT34_24370 [Rhizobium sophoriradicis]|uniref:Uncharacterized protein n=1 Tax=Rhizobium sophoriradicis TaxID=1535245 RepID=A0A2A5KN12_9HYPH|nr:hypothetical protein CPT34_24370 [Rhizobium sophoriradicis]